LDVFSAAKKQKKLRAQHSTRSFLPKNVGQWARPIGREQKILARLLTSSAQ
jgi:hypothetical protein